jgi:hypothetical protein
MSVGVAGCSEPATPISNACRSDVAPTVVTTTPPEFRWTPECDSGTVFVTTEAGNPMWQIGSEPQADFTPTNQIHSGVIYGVLPPNTWVAIEPSDLVPGQAYRLNLIVINSEGEDTHVGTVIFTIPAE